MRLVIKQSLIFHLYQDKLSLSICHVTPHRTCKQHVLVLCPPPSYPPLLPAPSTLVLEIRSVGCLFTSLIIHIMELFLFCAPKFYDAKYRTTFYPLLFLFVSTSSIQVYKSARDPNPCPVR